MSQQGTLYADSILTVKSPYEATETIRIRLSQAKLINKDFYLLFKEISELKRNYSQQLRRIIAENDSLDKVLTNQMLETKVLTSKELETFKFDSLGDLRSVWGSVISELKADLKASTNLYHTLNNEVILALERSTENDTKWSESKRLHSKLSQIAATIDRHSRNDDRENKLEDANRQWDSEVPALFELFQAIDHNRLEVLKNTSLRYHSGVSDYVLSVTKASESATSQVLEFEPQDEINRFAREAARYKFETVTAEQAIRADHQPSPAAKDKRRSTLGGIGHRFTSNSTVLHHDMMDGEFSNSENNSTLKQKKSSNKLRSKVGSIFGRHKLKNKKSIISERNTESTIVEAGNSSFDENVSNRSRSATASTNQSHSIRRPAMQSKDSDSLYRAPNHHIRAPNNKQLPPVAAGTVDEAPIKSNEPLAEVERDSSTTPMSISHPPLQPKSKTLPSEPEIETNQVSKAVTDANLGTQRQVDAKSLHIRAPALPPSRKHYPPNRNSEVFPPQNRASRSGSILASENANNPLGAQITGNLSMLNPQATGSSSLLAGQNLFQHTSLESSPLGLNASIAEVINASFKDGVLQDSQLIGEIALNYVANTAMNTPLPIEVNLKVPRADSFGKVMLNQAFLERVDPENFKINPQFIDGRTLGAVKYSMKDPVTPIVIHPVWRFEPHQASVVLTLKFSPSVPQNVTELVLEDLVVFVSIDGAETTSALSKPQGSFSKEKKRIIWRFKEPVTLQRDGEERLIARFLTDQTAHESEKGVVAKFIIHDEGSAQTGVGSDIAMEYQEVDENNPFGGSWNSVSAIRTVAAGNYHGTS